MTYKYPAIFSPEGDVFNVSFPDLPEALTFGADMDDAILMAKDVLRMCFDGRGRDGNIPEPSSPENIRLQRADEFVVMIDTENGIL